MLWAYVTIFLVGAVAVNAYEGYICCTPKQWEGQFAELGSVKFGYHTIGYADYSSLSLDQVSQQVAVDIHYISKYHKGEAKFILNFKQKKMYIIYGKKCRVRTIKHPFAPACISDKAKKIGSTYLGAGAHKLDITSYKFAKKGLFVTATINKDCIPVGELVFAKLKHAQIFKSISFFGITTGIKDRKVFVPPASCKPHLESLFAPPSEEVLRVKDQGEKEMEDMIEYFVHKFSSVLTHE